ncbi:MAG: hypothetical protein H0T76_11065 [Nannocystis sp.]|nr:hypothetical protein [Nannocystis sp.]MBA3547014.1 hypothetical protein [Nannocystis sp.]
MSVALLLVTVACDPTEAGEAPTAGKTDGKTDGKTAPIAGKPAATPDPAPSPVAEDVRPQAPGEAPGQDVRAAFSSCLRGCEDKKPADRAACRFNCEGPATTPAGVTTAVVDSDPVEYVVGCFDRCYSDGKRSETCTSACKSAVAALPATPSAAVLDSLGTCLDACHNSKHVSETDRATCGLNCTQVARVAGPAQPRP